MIEMHSLIYFYWILSKYLSFKARKLTVLIKNHVVAINITTYYFTGKRSWSILYILENNDK